jgi:tetratricopeptide (TPR) repeat protein
MSAAAYSRAGKFDEAIQEYRRALALAPNNAVLLGELALMYHAAMMDSEAVRYADKALAADPDLVPVRVLLAERALLQNDGEGALSEATRAVAVAPKDLPSRLAYADAHALLGHRDQAMTEYRRVLELFGDGEAQGAPKDRLELVKQAVAADALPAPRHALKAMPARSRPARKSRSRPSRSRPEFDYESF